MTRRTVAVVGGGLAGLSAGIHARRNGYGCTVFEHHPTHAGGVAAAWRRDDYLIDGGIHFMMGHRPSSALSGLYGELGIVPGVRMLDLDTFGCFHDESGGIRIEVGSDLERFVADVAALSPADERLAREFTSAAARLARRDLTDFGMAAPPEMRGPLDSLRDLWSGREMVSLAMGRFGRPMTEYAAAAHDERVRDLLLGLFVPEVPALFVLMLLALLVRRDVGLLEGGCRDLVDTLVGHLARLGGDLRLGSTVDEILVEGGRAVGVRLADGSEHRADAVIAAGDGRRTLFDLLGGRHVEPVTRERYEEWPRFAPLVLVSFGVERTYVGEPPFHMIRLAEPIDVGGRPIRMLNVRLLNYGPAFAPPGHTVVQAEAETTWEAWSDLQAADRQAYDDAKERVAGAMLAALDRRWPGTAAAVRVTDVATPYTWWRYTLNDRGAWEGWLLTPEALRTSMRRTLPGLGGLYMAGQWVMPGGGVPPVLYSGRHAVQLLCRDDGRPFAAGVSA